MTFLSGNVGIGTTTPGSALDVAGDINFTGTIRYAGAPEIQFINGDNVAVGRYALYAPTGTGTTALGDDALYANTTGSDDTGIGTGALGANTAGIMVCAAAWCPTNSSRAWKARSSTSFSVNTPYSPFLSATSATTRINIEQNRISRSATKGLRCGLKKSSKGLSLLICGGCCG
jgi:hypothetical protein